MRYGIITAQDFLEGRREPRVVKVIIECVCGNGIMRTETIAVTTPIKCRGCGREYELTRKED